MLRSAPHLINSPCHRRQALTNAALICDKGHFGCFFTTGENCSDQELKPATSTFRNWFGSFKIDVYQLHDDDDDDDDDELI